MNKKIYTLYRLYNSSATNPPKIWEKQYGIRSAVLILPSDAITMETTGFICPPEMLLVNKMTKARAAPIANGFPVAKITYTKNIEPTNSAKYVYIYIRHSFFLPKLVKNRCVCIFMYFFSGHAASTGSGAF